VVGKGLVKETKKAFAGARLGGGIGLSEADAIDDYASAKEIYAAKHKMNGKIRKISAQNLNKYSVGLAFLMLRGCSLALRAGAARRPRELAMF
jgi:hypothetical protein